MLILLLLAGTCRAESAAPAPEPAQNDPAVTYDAGVPTSAVCPQSPGGYTVPGRASIVDFDESGRIKIPEVPPAEAALARLTLSPGTRAKADQLLAERAAGMDAMVREQLREVVQLQTALSSGMKEQARRIISDLQSAREELRRMGRLGQDLHGVLTPPEHDELRRMVQEYWQARVREQTIADSARGRVADPDRYVRDELAYHACVEIRRAAQRVLGPMLRDAPRLLTELKLSPAQHGRVEQLVRAHTPGAMPVPGSTGDRLSLFVRVYNELDSEQQGLLLRSAQQGVTAERTDPSGIGLSVPRAGGGR